VTPVNDDRSELLARTLMDLLDVLAEDFDEFEMFSVLVDRAASLFEVSAVALLITNSRGQHRLVASSAAGGQAEWLFEIQRMDGPCLNSIKSGSIISAENLEEQVSRWPEFAATMTAAGYRGVHSIPLTLRGFTLGSLNFFTDMAHMLDESEVIIATTLANVTAIALTQSRALREADEMVLQLQRSLARRIATEQAKGMVAKRLGVEINEANNLLLNFAKNANRRMSEVALDIVEGQMPINRISPESVAPGV
jgi:GAF domain-containing protein